MSSVTTFVQKSVGTRLANPYHTASSSLHSSGLHFLVVDVIDSQSTVIHWLHISPVILLPGVQWVRWSHATEHTMAILKSLISVGVERRIGCYSNGCMHTHVLQLAGDDRAQRCLLWGLKGSSVAIETSPSFLLVCNYTLHTCMCKSSDINRNYDSIAIETTTLPC